MIIKSERLAEPSIIKEFSKPKSMPDLSDDNLLYECPLGLEGHCEGCKDKETYERYNREYLEWVDCPLYKTIIENEVSEVRILKKPKPKKTSINHRNDYTSLHDQEADGMPIIEALSTHPSFKRFTQR